MTDEVANEGEKNLNVEKLSTEGEAGDDKKENPAAEAEDKEPENKVNLLYHTQHSIDRTLTIPVLLPCLLRHVLLCSRNRCLREL